MKVLFISLIDINSINQRDLYSDLLREFVRENHEVFIVSPSEKRKNKPTELIETTDCESGRKVHILKVKTGNIQKTNFIKKGLSVILIENQITTGIKRYFREIAFDLVLYVTPPITIVKPIKYIKRRDMARTYLMLKDIFPQGAVGMSALSPNGPLGMLYGWFRKKEKDLYAISDKIGCMSEANIDFVIANNQDIDRKKVELCPNSIEVFDSAISESEKEEIRRKYGVPIDKKVFVYGGNLGKPQSIPFIIKCIEAVKRDDVFFLIVGDGTEYSVLQDYVKRKKPSNMKLMQRLPVNDYNKMILSCDVGMLFLDYRITVPNFPSRLLSYMQAKLPVLASTDTVSDVGKVIVDGKFGWWCPSNNASRFQELIDSIVSEDIKEMGMNGYEYLKGHYSSKECYNIIMEE